MCAIPVGTRNRLKSKSFIKSNSFCVEDKSNNLIFAHIIGAMGGLLLMIPLVTSE